MLCLGYYTPVYIKCGNKKCHKKLSVAVDCQGELMPTFVLRKEYYINEEQNEITKKEKKLIQEEINERFDEQTFGEKCTSCSTFNVNYKTWGKPKFVNLPQYLIAKLKTEIGVDMFNEGCDLNLADNLEITIGESSYQLISFIYNKDNKFNSYYKTEEGWCDPITSKVDTFSNDYIIDAVHLVVYEIDN